jgi:hypothetical protein
MALSFPAASIAWKMQSTDQLVLQLLEHRHALGQVSGRVVLGEAGAGEVGGVVVLQAETLAALDAKALQGLFHVDLHALDTDILGAPRQAQSTTSAWRSNVAASAQP